MSITPVNTDVAGEIKKENEFKYNINNIPKDVIRELAKTFMPDIIEFYDSEEGKDFYENWKKNKK